MPGTGTNDRRRNRISAPMVNHRRFLSSVAFWKFANVMLEARCSAADAIRYDSSKRCGSYKLHFRHCEERRNAPDDVQASALAPALREPFLAAARSAGFLRSISS